MDKRPLPSLAILQEFFDYDSITCHLVWKSTDPYYRRCIGKRVDTKRTISIRHVTYKTSHIIWFLHTGKMAPDEIDHIDRNDCNNHISNLRESTRSQNQANTRLSRKNTLGVKGIIRSGIGYQARIKINGVDINLGTYRTLEQAKRVREKAFEKVFGEFAKHN